MKREKSFARRERNDVLRNYEFPLTDLATVGTHAFEASGVQSQNLACDYTTSEERRNAVVDPSGNLEEKAHEISNRVAVRQEWQGLEDMEREIERMEEFLRGSERRMEEAVSGAMTKYKETHYPNPVNHDLTGIGLPSLSARFRDTQLTPSRTPRKSGQSSRRPLTAQSSIAK